MHSYFLPSRPHEPHVPVVSLADEEVHVEVAEVEVVAADEGLHSVKAVHLEVLAPDATVGLSAACGI